MKCKNITIGLGLAFATLLAITPAAAKGKKDIMKNNPFAHKSALPYGAPDFSVIKNSDYLPAIEAGIALQRAEISRITSNKKLPTFANTILAYEQSGLMLDRVSSVFFALSGSDATPEIEDIEAKAIPLLTAFSNEVNFNDKLFQRVKAVYDTEYATLKGEDKQLLKKIYDGFVRSGALLDGTKKARLEDINNRIAVLQQHFGKELPKAANASTVWISDKRLLAGLSAGEIAQCAKDAKDRGGKAPYCIVIVNTTQQPLLSNLENRDVRRQVYEASINRANGTRGINLYPLIVEMAKLRAEKAEILGYENYAAYALADKMAKTPANTYDFLRSLIAAYRPKADAETASIEAYARKTVGADFTLEPYDRFFFSAKMKQEQFDFNEEDVSEYFKMDSVLINGVFYAANRVYGLTFKQRHDIPVYQEDVKVFDVYDKQGEPLALFYFDPFRRTTKRGGAWMGGFAKQSNLRHQLPVIYNVHNIAKAPEGQPTLLTWDETTTLFHEFGHGLHGILSDCMYNTLSGTAVARDFVELPSQFNEFFASVPEVFSHYAKSYKTGQPMPEDLKERMLKSLNFQPAYALGENLAATCADLAWHMLASKDVPTAAQAGAFETESLRKIGLLDAQVPPRYHTSYFNHVWGGGYAAGYYSYLWSEVLADNVADYFRTHGSLSPEVGSAFRAKLLSKGGTEDLSKIFTDFTGLAQPDATGLLKARGL